MRTRPVSYVDPVVTELVEHIQGFYRQRYGHHDRAPIDPAQFEPPAGRFLLGEVGDRPVACGGWRRVEQPDAEQPGDGVEGAAAAVPFVAELKRMFVLPEARRNGYARALLAVLERDAASAGACRMVLETGSEQPEAIALYVSSGYTASPPFGYYRCEPRSRFFGKDLHPCPPGEGADRVDGDLCTR